MSYKLEKPYTEEEYASFVVELNHNNGRTIEETETAVYALEVDEMLDDSGVPGKNPNYEEEQAERERIARTAEIKAELNELDTKRIRAMCEPSVYDGNGSVATGVSSGNGTDVGESVIKTWLDYYNNQAQALREELADFR